MPITPAHQWHESENWVSINVKIPNVTTSSADIITTECYVKVNSPPYFFEADLYGEVDCKMSKASIGFGAVKFFLVKKDHRLWERLSMQGDRNILIQRRQESLEAIRKEREKVRKEYPAKFSNLGRLAVGEQMRMEEVKRKIIQDRKEAENLMEQENIETWKENLIKLSPIDGEHRDSRPPTLQDKWGTSTTYDARLTSKKADNAAKFTQHEEKNLNQSSSSLVGKSIPKDLGTFKTIKDSNENCRNPHEGGPSIKDSQANDQASILDGDTQLMRALATTGSCESNVGISAGVRYNGLTLPAPRKCPIVSVTFSPKPDLPKHLPARESRDREIKLKKSGKACEDTLDVSERAPLFLQDKGDKFFKAGDYQSAINAYTDALAKDPSLVISLANRGACKLHLKEYKACVQDCTSAMCILTKGTPDYAQETILAQNSLIPSAACNPPNTSCDGTNHENHLKELVDESPKIRVPLESLELLTCLSGQGCCSMQGLRIEGAGVEEWQLGMKNHMLLRRGVARYHLGDLYKAIDDFAKAIKIKPSNDVAQRMLTEMRMCLAFNSK